MNESSTNDLMLAQLLDMGYTAEAASAAMRVTGGTGLNEAVSWLLDNPSGEQEVGVSPPRVALPSPQRRAPQDGMEFFSPLGAAHAADMQARQQHSGAEPSGYQQEKNVTAPHGGVIWDAAVQDQHQQAEHPQQQRWQSSDPAFYQEAATYQQPVGHRQLAGHQQSAGSQQSASSRDLGASPTAHVASRGRSAAPSGVAALLAREQQKAAAADRVLDTALQDLQTLMEQAHEMVELAEQFRQALARTAPETASEEVMVHDLADDLVSMGIAVPVTKQTAGKQYHQQLAQQLSEFLGVPLERAGGLITLPDVFCLFNRARGVELISADDLLAAVKRLPAVGAPMELRELADGVRVLQSNSHSNEQVCSRIAQLVYASKGLGPPLSISSTAASLQVPLAIAQQHLLTAESCGTLCRDQGPDGLRWFHNFFAEAPVA